MYIYYRITCYTPYCGEENDYYTRVKDDKELLKFADEFIIDNANEWYDESEVGEDYPDIEDYYAECYYKIEEITAKEYYENNPWDKEEE